MDKENLKKIYAKIDSYKNEMIDLQGKLTAIPAISPESGGKGEWEKAKAIKSFMNNMKFDLFEEHNAKDSRVTEGTRPNFVGRINGKNTKKTVWIMSHMDVVPEGERKHWKSDPFKIKVDGDLIYGRGTEDNQQALVSSLFAVKALKDLNITPANNIGVIIVADEETGSRYGIEHVLKSAKKLFSKEDLIIVPDAGDSEGTMVEVAEKGILWIKFIITGKQTHGSTPQKGINAHRAGACLIMKLKDLYKEFDYKDTVFDPPISTFEPTKKENNVPNVNTIPGEDIFYMDCRVLPKYSLEDVIAKVKRYSSETEKEYRVKIELEFPNRNDAVPATPVDAPVVKALKVGIKDVYKVEPKPIGIGGGTVAAYFRKEGYYAVCWTKLDDTLHGPNEYSRISNMIGDTKVFANVFMQE